MDEIATAAARAGLQFIILTDHGDGTRAPDPPSYLHGVLVIDGVEMLRLDPHHWRRRDGFGLNDEPMRDFNDGEKIATYGLTHSILWMQPN